MLIYCCEVAKGQEAADEIKQIERLIAKAKNHSTPDSSIRLASQALEQSRKITYKHGIESGLHLLAQNHWKKKETSNALRNYLQLINEVEKVNDSLKTAWIYLEVGMIYKTESLNEKALEYLLKALKTFPDDDFDLMLVEESIGDVYLELERYKDARTHYQNALGVAQRESANPKIISIYQAIVNTFKEEENYNKVLEYYLKIQEKIKETGNKDAEALALNNIGYTYKFLQDYDNALKYFQATMNLLISIKASPMELSVLYTNIGVIYQNSGRYNLSLENLIEAKKIIVASGKPEDIANIYDLLAIVYFNIKDYHNARYYNEEALKIATSSRLPKVRQACYKTASVIYQELSEYKKALDYYKLHLSIRDSLLVEDRIRQQNVLQQQFVIERTEKELKLLMVGEEIKDMEINRLLLESQKVDKENELLRQSQQVQELKAKEALQILMLSEQKYEAEKKDKQIKLLYQNEQLQKVLLKQNELQEQENEKEIELLVKDGEISKLEIEKQKSFRKYLYLLSGSLSAILVLIFVGLVITRKAKAQVEKKNKEIFLQNKEIEENRMMIEKEKEKSEQLLLNILPQKIAEELKENGKAKPQHYEKVSVLFTDFVGFTGITEKTAPDKLIEDLNYFFLKFDEIIEKHSLEKIKTIGDAYMCAGGVPLANDTNPHDAVMAGLEISEFMMLENRKRSINSEEPWGIRIGVHTGSIVAGVVGKNKFVYDIWGDAVNIASRIESNSVEGRVNVSGDTYELIKDKFACTFRGEIDAKNKGKIAMYFVDKKL